MEMTEHLKKKTKHIFITIYLKQQTVVYYEELPGKENQFISLKGGRKYSRVSPENSSKDP